MTAKYSYLNVFRILNYLFTSSMSKKNSNMYKLVTYITSVPSIVGMYEAMLIVHRSSQKAFITNGTLEGPLSRMYFTYMVLQVGSDCVAGFAAFMRTGKRFDS